MKIKNLLHKKPPLHPFARPVPDASPPPAQESVHNLSSLVHPKEEPVPTQTHFLANRFGMNSVDSKQITQVDNQPSDSIVHDPEVDQAIIQLMEKHWPGVTIKNHRLRNPSPNPVSLTLKGLHEHLAQHEYLATEKSDGNRYLFIMIVHPRTKKEMAFMMDRSMRLYMVSVCASSDFFKGTLLDGELVSVSGNPTLKCMYFFDAICVADQGVAQEDLHTRIAILRDCVYHEEAWQDELSYNDKVAQSEAVARSGKIIFLFNRPNMITSRVKEFFPMKRLDDLLSQRMDHRSDGLIFTPVHQPVKAYTHFECFKWKVSHTLDFIVQLSMKNGKFACSLLFGNDSHIQQFSKDLPSYNLCHGIWYHDDFETMKANLRLMSSQKKSRPPIAKGDWTWVQCVPDPSAPLFQELVNQVRNQQTTCTWIGEFELEWNKDSDKPIRCTLQRIREDKPIPNNFRTVQQTLLNIRENIQIETIKSCL